jgi:hypothetical protein
MPFWVDHYFQILDEFRDWQAPFTFLDSTPVTSASHHQGQQQLTRVIVSSQAKEKPPGNELAV